MTPRSLIVLPNTRARCVPGVPPGLPILNRHARPPLRLQRAPL